MTARKQTVSFTGPAFAYARTLVDAGEYPSISAAEVERRLDLPIDRWEPVGELSEVSGEVRARLARLRRAEAGEPG